MPYVDSSIPIPQRRIPLLHSISIKLKTEKYQQSAHHYYQTLATVDKATLHTMKLNKGELSKMSHNDSRNI